MQMIVMKEEGYAHRSLETRRHDTPWNGPALVSRQRGRQGRSWLRAYSIGVFAEGKAGQKE